MKKFAMMLGLITAVIFPAALWADDEPIQGPVTTPTAVPNAPSESPSGELITVSLSPLLGVPVSGNTAREYNVGGGGEVYLSVEAEKNFLFGFDIGFQDYTVNTTAFANSFQQLTGSTLPAGVSVTGDFTYFPVLAMVKYSFNTNKVRPYILWGTGLALNSASAAVSYNGQTVKITGSETDFLETQGLGVAFETGDSSEIFFQARLDVDFTSSNNSDTFTITSNGPVQTAKGNLSDDSPTLFLPIQLGVRFK